MNQYIQFQVHLMVAAEVLGMDILGKVFKMSKLLII
jgi:hypothetical protein